MSTFHVADGLYFSQGPDGEVRVTKKNLEAGEIVLQYSIDKHAWASVIATMSYYGEEDYGFYRAMNFHTGEPMGVSTPPNFDKLKPLTVEKLPESRVESIIHQDDADETKTEDTP